jgi:hypothetical protein
MLGINRNDLLIVALVSLPIEVISLSLLMFFPVDVGYPAGTHWLWYTTLWGVWVHLPALALGTGVLPNWALLPAAVIIGYFEHFIAVLAVLVAWRCGKRLRSTLGPHHR